MPALTFDEVCRKVQLRVPLASALLVQDFVQQGYEGLCGLRRWSWLRGESQFLVAAQKSGTVDLTNASATVTGVGLTFAATDKDRQLRVSGIPYTIISVDTGTNTAVLDQVYGGATATAATVTVFDAYVRVPDDFGSFWGIFDESQDDVIDLWMTEEELSIADPNRSEAGNPRAVVSRRLSTVTAFDGLPEYELWPYQTTQKRFPYTYGKQPEQLSLTKAFRGPLRHQTSVLITAALKHAAEWPGPSGDKPNPYFNLALAQRLEQNLTNQLEAIERQDEEIYLTWLETVPWMKRYPIRGGRDFRSHE